MRDFVLGAIVGSLLGSAISFAGFNYTQHQATRIAQESRLHAPGHLANQPQPEDSK